MVTHAARKPNKQRKHSGQQNLFHRQEIKAVFYISKLLRLILFLGSGLRAKLTVQEITTRSQLVFIALYEM